MSIWTSEERDLALQMMQELIHNLAGLDAGAVIMAPALTDQVCHIRQGFTGARTGNLVVQLPLGLARTLASRALHMPEEKSMSSELAIDAAGEIMNIFSGKFLADLAGEDDPIHMSLPEKSLKPPGSFGKELAGTTSLLMAVDGLPLLVDMVSPPGDTA